MGKSVFLFLQKIKLIIKVFAYFIHFYLQVEEELLTYDSNSNGSFKHTWYLPEFRKENIYFTAPSSAIDANTTFTVS